MGMFDYVRCRYPLPAPEVQEKIFQTKDTPEPGMVTWVIGADGSLALESEPAKDIPVWGLIRGPLIIYTGHGGFWYDVRFEFADGRVTAVKVTKSALEPPRPAADSAGL